MKNSPKGFLVLFLVIIGALGVGAGSYYVKTHLKAPVVIENSVTTPEVVKTEETSSSVYTEVPPVTEVGLKVDLVGVKIKGEIPKKIFQTAYDYLVERLGSDYVKNNISIAEEQTENQSNYPSYRVEFVDKRLTKLLGEPGNEVDYSIDVDRNNKIDQKWIVINNNIPNCVKNPALCKTRINKEQAGSIVAKAAGGNSNTSLVIRTGSVCARLGRNYPKDSVSSLEGWFWVNFGSDPLLEINIADGSVNRCVFEIAF